MKESMVAYHDNYLTTPGNLEFKFWSTLRVNSRKTSTVWNVKFYVYEINPKENEETKWRYTDSLVATIGMTVFFSCFRTCVRFCFCFNPAAHLLITFIYLVWPFLHKILFKKAYPALLSSDCMLSVSMPINQYWYEDVLFPSCHFSVRTPKEASEI